jgi:hypothetical protein
MSMAVKFILDVYGSQVYFRCLWQEIITQQSPNSLLNGLVKAVYITTTITISY